MIILKRLVLIFIILFGTFTFSIGQKKGNLPGTKIISRVDPVQAELKNNNTFFVECFTEDDLDNIEYLVGEFQVNINTIAEPGNGYPEMYLYAYGGYFNEIIGVSAPLLFVSDNGLLVSGNNLIILDESVDLENQVNYCGNSHSSMISSMFNLTLAKKNSYGYFEPYTIYENGEYINLYEDLDMSTLYIDDLYNVCCHQTNSLVSNDVNQNELFESPNKVNFKPDDMAMNIYPNPTSQILNIYIHNIKEFEEIIISIFDINGRKLNIQKKNIRNSFFEEGLDVSNFNRGVYFVEIKDYNGSSLLPRIKFIKI